jgi:hypothetical protein
VRSLSDVLDEEHQVSPFSADDRESVDESDELELEENVTFLTKFATPPTVTFVSTRVIPSEKLT